MAVKKSKAREVAEKLSGSLDAAPVVHGGLWTRVMVERAIVAFNDIERVPPFDEDALRELVKDFLRFAERMDKGGIQPDAMPLAQAFAERAYAWLDEHPHLLPFTTAPWTLEMVEQLVVWFEDAIAVPKGSKDKKRSREVAERVYTFERVAKNGAVVEGDAAALAKAFLLYARRWIEGEPEALAHYESLA